MGTMNTTYPEMLWAGTDHALVLAEQGHVRLLSGMFDAKPPPMEEKPYNFDVHGSVGIIAINGPLVNRDSPFNRYFGVTSYADIRRAVIYAASDPTVGSILLDINSGGGDVSGVSDAANLISEVNAKIKKVYAFTDGGMMSAAYWLGSSADKVYGSETAMMGSIGVIATHKEYSKAFKEAGIGVTVMRAGEYKALANSNEPLTNPAKAQIQEQLNGAYAVFAEHVADARGVSLSAFEAKMGQGREFFGASAVEAGLSDGVMSLDALLSKLEAKNLDTSGKKANNLTIHPKGPGMPRAALTEQQIAALQSGAPLSAVAATEQDAAAVAAALAASTAAAEAAAATAAAEAAAAPAAAAPAATAPAAAAAPQADVVSYLQGQLTTAIEASAALKLQLDKANGDLAALKATHEPLRQIAAKSVSHMKVGLGMANVDLTSMSAETLLAEHAATSEAFTKAFAVGGVAAVSMPKDDKAEKVAANDPLRRARIEATRLVPLTK